MSLLTRPIKNFSFGVTALLAMVSTQIADAKPLFKPVKQLTSKIPGIISGSTSFTIEGTTIDIGPSYGDNFGQSVWIRGDYAFVGSSTATPNGNIFAGGAVYVYKRNGSHWTNTQILTTGGISDLVSFQNIDSQGNWLVVSAIGTPLGSNAPTAAFNKDLTGSVLIYHLDNHGKWKHKQTIAKTSPGLSNLTPITLNGLLQGQGGALFGCQFSLDLKHKTLFVGAQDQQFLTDQGNAITNSGEVFVFRLNKKKKHWGLKQKITSPDGVTTNNHFGGNMIVKDGIALISAQSNFGRLEFPTNGAVYLYNRHDDGSWHFVQKVVSAQKGTTQATLPAGSSFIGDGFGSNLAIGDGWAAVGSPLESQSGASILRGAAYLYKIEHSGGKPSLHFRQKIFSNDPNAHYTTGDNGLAIKKHILLVCDPTRAGPKGARQGGVMVFKLENGKWKQKDTIYNPHSTAYSFFGTSVAFDGKYMIAGGSTSFPLSYNANVNIPPLAPAVPDGTTPSGTAVIFQLRE